MKKFVKSTLLFFHCLKRGVIAGKAAVGAVTEEAAKAESLQKPIFSVGLQKGWRDNRWVLHATHANWTVQNKALQAILSGDSTSFVH
ncbi:MAG: hypothetical protein LBS96_06695 [Oscillospiraceae bacterium]|jgi:hypothetical protein|nr:hypothetical protein [Oscillospiraceae bacterium]